MSSQGALAYKVTISLMCWQYSITLGFSFYTEIVQYRHKEDPTLRCLKNAMAL